MREKEREITVKRAKAMLDARSIGAENGRTSKELKVSHSFLSLQFRSLQGLTWECTAGMRLKD